MKRVSKDKFYEVVGPQDVIPEAGREKTIWKTRAGKVVGETSGYMITDPDEKYYALANTEAA